jgi:PAS domain S-box-containing protein
MNTEAVNNISNLKTENESLRRELAVLKRRYEDLENRELETSLLLEELPLGEIVLDKDAKFIAYNTKFANLLGYSKEELIGKDFSVVLAEGLEQHAKTFPVFRNVGVDINLTWKMRKKDGDVVTTVLYAKAKFAKSGNFVYGRGYIVDISDKVALIEALRKSEREKTLILESMSECVAYYGKDMRVIWANNNAASILQRTIPDILGKTCKDFCNKDRDYCRFCPVTLSLANLTPQSDEINIDENAQITMAVHPVINDKGEFDGMVQMVTDITERKMLEKRLSDASNFERRKVGQDIHDGLSQTMTGIVFMASALQAELESRKSTLAKDAEDIVFYTKNALSTLRGLIQGLCPVGIDPQGLISALRNLTENIESVYRIKCRFICDDSIIVSNYDVANHIYLIAQESACNAAKHSQCSTLTITFKRIKTNIKLSIEDNGIGIEGDLRKCKGMGIRIIKNRAMAIKGLFPLKTSPAFGTKVSVALPENNLNNTAERNNEG